MSSFLFLFFKAHVRVTVRSWDARVGFPAMTTMWGAPLHKRWRGSRLRDPRQARFLTVASLK
ncbi:MAG: hypothetical protein QOJ20_958, partial [Mycobacterium sp.]|nr:hypothetical protein [Mycobacterium sp.]